MYRCNKCQIEKELGEFRTRPTKHGYSRICKKCESERNVEWNNANRDRKKETDRAAELNRPPRRAWTKHGLTGGQYKNMLLEQEGACKICAEPMDRIVIDHDHDCCPGKFSCGGCVRGLLCPKCNVMLGLARDNPMTLLSAIDYLEAGDT